ncbi:MAG TPA: futalosine hydrolase [Longimicrobiaceae bacterium]|nr:futalosine hydrolase [Longimicrobiaceae bacterium]
METGPTTPVALVCSVPLEAEPVRRALRAASTARVGGKEAVEGVLGTTRVVLLAAGMGKVNAAHGLTALLEARPVRAVVGFGVGGAYPGAGLDVGAVALATREIYGDEGADTPAGWISTESIGIALAEREGERLFNEFPVDPKLLSRARRALQRAGMPAVAGPFVTVSCCSGTLARGESLAHRFSAVCESMEGAAYAHVAAIYGVPFMELRGISNLVENRDLARWRLKEAAEAAARAVQFSILNFEF